MEGLVTRTRRLLASERIRYLLVGVWNTLFGFLLFVGLVVSFGDRVHYTLLLVVSHVICVLAAFAAYRWLVFKVRGGIWLDLLRFWSVYAAAMAVNLVALPLLVRVVGLDVIVAQAGLVVATVVTTYVLNRRFSFRRPAPAGQEASSTTAI